MQNLKISTLTNTGSNLEIRGLYRRLLISSLASFLLFLVSFALVPTLISEASATDATTDVTWKSLSLTLDPDYGNGSTSDLGHGDVDFGEIVPTGANDAGNVGTMKVAKKTIGVFSAGNYYSVFLSMAGTSNSLTKTGDTTQNISAVSGTWSSPAAFSGTGWGYAVPTKTITSGWTTPFDSAQAGTYSSYNSFLVDPSDPDANNLTKQGTGSSVYNTGTWAAIPTSSQTAQQIWKNSTSNAIGFEDGDFFDVYYAVMADIDIMAGTYSNEIVYTALASSSALDRASTNISRDIEFVTSGTTETLEIDLATVPATALTDDDVTVAVVPHATIASANYSPTGLTIGNYDKCAVQSIVSANKGATITCTMPTIGTGNIQIADDTTTANGEYDFWVQVNKYGQTMNYISKYTASGSNVATVVYAGLQSKNTSGKFYITEMQEMTGGVCQNTNMWGTGVGVNARIYDYTGSGAALASTAATSATVNTGTFLLKDNRDQKTYLVRRLADGNCWMVQNLDLNLKNFAGTRKLTSANTDLNDKEYWDPSETLKNSQWVFNSTNITGGYANHLGIANILEPGPGYSTVGELSISQYQFQSRLNFGPNLFWGSRYQAGTIVDNTSGDNNNGLYINGNVNVLYPRSYDNGFAYYDSNLFIDSDSGYRMIPVIPDAAGEVGKILQSSDYLTIDSEWQPELVMNQTGEKYTMRGNVYLGDYYNNYAAYAGNASDGHTLEQNSICPKGWRLPSENIDEEKSWRKLLMDIYDIIEDDGDIIQFESIAKQFLLPISLGYTGQYNGTKGSLWDRSTYGYMYTSHNTLYMYRMNGKVSSSFPRPYMGNTLRCVARD